MNANTHDGQHATGRQLVTFSIRYIACRLVQYRARGAAVGHRLSNRVSAVGYLIVPPYLGELYRIWRRSRCELSVFGHRVHGLVAKESDL